MNATVETLSPTRVKLTVEVPFEELAPSIDTAYKRDRPPGEGAGLPAGQGPAAHPRPARRPRRRARGGAQRRPPAALPRGRRRAPASRAIGPPDVDVTQFDDGEPLVFTAEVDVRPDIELPAYDGLPVGRRRRHRHRRGGRRAARLACATGSRRSRPVERPAADRRLRHSSTSTPPPSTATPIERLRGHRAVVRGRLRLAAPRHRRGRRRRVGGRRAGPSTAEIQYGEHAGTHGDVPRHGDRR